MNDEIKEILDRLDYDEWEVDLYKVPITWSELYNIRDYITNLQQENERLKMRNDMLRKDIDSFVNDNKVDYKSRIEKAIPMLKELNIKLKGILNTGIDIKEISDIEDTLNGRSE